MITLSKSEESGRSAADSVTGMLSLRTDFIETLSPFFKPEKGSGTRRNRKAISASAHASETDTDRRI